MGAGSGGFILGVLKAGCSREDALEAAQLALRGTRDDALGVALSLEQVELVV